ncbi:MAG TPA: hypothetical protein VH063_08390 [Gaiellaceae bacterium]|jgi:hypothetical protein|nr:hypothetical protein [Gaiellaceae bacterium]
MTLADELERAAAAAAGYGEVSAVLAAEPAPERRAYLVALGTGEARAWLALDGGLRPVAERDRAREIASIVVLCELAGELAGGDQLEELREQLAQVRLTEQPPGIEEADEAALALERAIGAPPIVASPAYLDAVGAAASALERSLGDHASPFATALAASAGTVEAFVAEVEGRHVLPLR